MIVNRICEICGNIFDCYERQDGRTQRFCSRKCLARYFSQSGHKPPALSGKDNGHWVESIKLTCSNCGIIYERKPWQVKKHNHSKGKFKIGTFCSKECRTEYVRQNMKGKKNPDYVGETISYYGVRWTEARDKVRKRDGYRCQFCHIKRENIHVHHVISYRLFKSAEDANVLSNLICLCNHCHAKVTQNKLAITPRLL